MPEASLRAGVVGTLRAGVHGSIGRAMKNVLDHFWHELAVDLSVAYRRASMLCLGTWHCVAFHTDADLKCSIVSQDLRKRFLMIRDARVYGALPARKPRRDLEADKNCFLAHYRK
jgi:hypothetical protein